MDVLVTRRLVTCSLLPTWSPPKSGNFFTLTDELFYLNLDHGPITVYAYLLCCEDHRTHQSHPNYKTISTATGLAVNTVMKHMPCSECPIEEREKGRERTFNPRLSMVY